MGLPEQAPVQIDTASIPDSTYQVGCAVLAKSIRKALSDPELRREYEDWKAKKAADAAKK